MALRSWGSPGVGLHGGLGGMVLRACSGAWPHSRDSSHTEVAVLNGVVVCGTRTVVVLSQQLWCGTLHRGGMWRIGRLSHRHGSCHTGGGTQWSCGRVVFTWSLQRSHG